MADKNAWLLYGATGYTGRLVVQEALRMGIRPILAGRSRGALERLAQESGLDHQVISLDDTPGLDEALDQVGAVLHCAVRGGP